MLPFVRRNGKLGLTAATCFPCTTWKCPRKVKAGQGWAAQHSLAVRDARNTSVSQDRRTRVLPSTTSPLETQGRRPARSPALSGGSFWGCQTFPEAEAPSSWRSPSSSQHGPLGTEGLQKGCTGVKPTRAPGNGYGTRLRAGSEQDRTSAPSTGDGSASSAEAAKASGFAFRFCGGLRREQAGPSCWGAPRK